MDSVFDEVDHIDVSDANVIVFKSNIDRDMKHASREKHAVIPHRELSSVSTATCDDDEFLPSCSSGSDFLSLI